jgi:hypothetical protein
MCRPLILLRRKQVPREAVPNGLLHQPITMIRRPRRSRSLLLNLHRQVGRRARLPPHQKKTSHNPSSVRLHPVVHLQPSPRSPSPTTRTPKWPEDLIHHHRRDVNHPQPLYLQHCPKSQRPKQMTNSFSPSKSSAPASAQTEEKISSQTGTRPLLQPLHNLELSPRLNIKWRSPSRSWNLQRNVHLPKLNVASSNCDIPFYARP